MTEHVAPLLGRVTSNGDGDHDKDGVDLLAGLRNGAWLDAQDFAPLTFAVPSLIPEGFTLLVGPPKVGKSWLVLGAALGVSCGGRVFGSIPVEARPVLYMALEDGDRRLQERCRVLMEDTAIPSALDYMTKAQPGQVLKTIQTWLDLHVDASPLVVLDTLGRVMPPALVGETVYQRDYRIGAAVKRIADDHPGVAIVVTHHTRKAGSDDFIDNVSGTNGLAGSADTIAVLCRQREAAHGVLQVTGRDIREGEYALRLERGSTWLLDGSSLSAAMAKARQLRATAGLEDRSADIITFVSDNPDGVSPSEVAEALGLDSHTAGTYLGRLTDAGRLARPKRGLYTPVESVESVEGGPGE